MNRLVLVGNGFDLAHELKTSYQDFINWYWDKRVQGLRDCRTTVSEDVLCRFIIRTSQTWNTHYLTHLVYPKISGKDFVKLMKENDLFKVEESTFFRNICNSIEEKGWVDIENEYYRLLKSCTLKKRDDDELKKLNELLQYIQDLLIEYLSSLEQPKKSNEIFNKIYAPIDAKDLTIDYLYHGFNDFLEYCLKQDKAFWEIKLSRYGKDPTGSGYIYDIENYKLLPQSTPTPKLFMLPDNVMLLTFNYTNTTDLYNRDEVTQITHIHGTVSDPESVIFGYGDELDDSFSALQDLGDNECLSFIKSYKYLDATNYRNTLAFLDSGPFQVFIFGHSCGNSDRTLLNTIFEHKNCISIKPFFYVKKDGIDNYRELIQNISRNFTDMKLMRDRVVNKTYCEPLVKRK